MRYVLKKLHPITAVKKTEVAMEVDSLRTASDTDAARKNNMPFFSPFNEYF